MSSFSYHLPFLPNSQRARRDMLVAHLREIFYSTDVPMDGLTLTDAVLPFYDIDTPPILLWTLKQLIDDDNDKRGSPSSHTAPFVARQRRRSSRRTQEMKSQRESNGLSRSSANLQGAEHIQISFYSLDIDVFIADTSASSTPFSSSSSLPFPFHYPMHMHIISFRSALRNLTRSRRPLGNNCRLEGYDQR
ncbi:hypothetical protein SCHPADRAFT_652417 [Schizopora paradoxa]|uniref:Uncharacterized protein n=1 Tax=Schizopora paradoxa TaxID=27342 RepID=A0A0H2RCW0_9AGAM|nr:hypothetical protein SCHPADRAFT_652417 [Schizopora paradoxa]